MCTPNLGARRSETPWIAHLHGSRKADRLHRRRDTSPVKFSMGIQVRFAGTPTPSTSSLQCLPVEMKFRQVPTSRGRSEAPRVLFCMHALGGGGRHAPNQPERRSKTTIYPEWDRHFGAISGGFARRLLCEEAHPERSLILHGKTGFQEVDIANINQSCVGESQITIHKRAIEKCHSRSKQVHV